MCSDAFPNEMVGEEAPGIIKVQSRLMTAGGEEINTGGNARLAAYDQHSKERGKREFYWGVRGQRQRQQEPAVCHW